MHCMMQGQGLSGYFSIKMRAGIYILYLNIQMQKPDFDDLCKVSYRNAPNMEEVCCVGKEINTTTMRE